MNDVRGIACTNCGEPVGIDAPAYSSLDGVPVDAKEVLIVQDGIVLAAYCETCVIDAHPSITIVSEADGDSMPIEIRRALFQRWSFLTAWGPMRSIITPYNRIVVLMADGKRVEEEL